MLTYSFENIGNESLYQHLYNSIKKDILDGKLSKGDKLPSKRAFAKHLNISTITIETAYNNLLSEGYIYSIPKKGYYVAEISNNHSYSLPSQEIKDLKPITNKYVNYTANFNSNHTNPNNFPFSIWAKLLREVINNHRTDLMTNSPFGGILELREAIANHLYNYRGISVHPEQIIIGAGTEYLYSLLIQLLGRNKIYAIENPSYKKIGKIYTKNNVKIKYITVENSGISLDELYSSNADILHISPSHHFPTGIVTPISLRHNILKWASEDKNRYIIEDDYDSEFRFIGKPIPTLQSIDTCKKVIYINTFSKSLASTIRISYMILPNHLLKKYQEELSFYSCTVSTFEQYTLAKFISENYFEKHINRMRIYYKNLRNKILDTLKNSAIKSQIKITEKDSGLHFLIEITNGLTDSEIKKRAKKLNINIAFLSEYYYTPRTNKHTNPTLVINYSGIQPENIEAYIKLLCQCIKL